MSFQKSFLTLFFLSFIYLIFPQFSSAIILSSSEMTISSLSVEQSGTEVNFYIWTDEIDEDGLFSFWLSIDDDSDFSSPLHMSGEQDYYFGKLPAYSVYFNDLPLNKPLYWKIDYVSSITIHCAKSVTIGGRDQSRCLPFSQYAVKNADESFIVSDVQPLSFTSFTAQPACDGRISMVSLNWQAQNADSYVVWRAETGITRMGVTLNLYKNVSGNITTTNFTDRNVFPGRVYYYYITASGPGGAQNSSTVDVTTLNCQPTLAVSLSANPLSGPLPLNGVDLNASVSGTAKGTVNYTFYCNRSDTGANITSPWDFKIDATNQTSFNAVDVCSYSSAGAFTAKVIAERENLAAEARQTITVTNVAPKARIGCDPINCIGYVGSPLILLNQSTDAENNINKSEWSITGPVSQSHSCSGLCNFTPQSITTGSYTATLTVTDLGNLTSSISKIFTIKRDIRADFECSIDNKIFQDCSKIKPRVDDKVYFKDASIPSEGASINSWNWTFSQGQPNKSSGANPNTIFKKDGSNKVTLKVIDTNSKSAEISKTIDVEKKIPEWQEVAPF